MIFHRWSGNFVIAIPADSGLYQVLALPELSELPRFRQSLEESYLEYIRRCDPVARALPDTRTMSSSGNPWTPGRDLLTRAGELGRAIAPDSPVTAAPAGPRTSATRWTATPVTWRRCSISSGSPARTERQRQAFPSAHIELLKGHGHWVMLEDPGRVASLVIPFLRRQLPDPATGSPASPPPTS